MDRIFYFSILKSDLTLHKKVYKRNNSDVDNDYVNLVWLSFYVIKSNLHQKKYYMALHPKILFFYKIKKIQPRPFKETIIKLQIWKIRFINLRTLFNKKNNKNRCKCF